MRVTIIDLWGREGMLHYCSQLANSLTNTSEVEVTVLIPRGSDIEYFQTSVTLDFVDVVKDASVGELLSVPINLVKIPLMFKTIRQSRPDVIHLNNCHVWYILILPWLRRHYPIVSTMHDVEPHPGLDDSWRKHREIDALARMSHHIFVHGETLKQRLLERYPARTEDEITVIPHGDYSLFTQYQTDVVEDKKLVLFFGRIRAYKGLEHFIEAAKMVAHRIPEARFVIAGDGDFKPYRKLLGEGTRFEIHNKRIPDADVAAFFSRSSIVVLPYIEASQSGVVQIAYAFKKPVVTTHVGCLPDVVVEGQTGLMVPPRDVPALAAAMLKLLDDDELRKAMGRNAHIKVRNEFGWDKIATTTCRAYQSAIQGFDPIRLRS